MSDLISRMRRRLGCLDAASVELFDESEGHIGHAGYREGGSHFRLEIVSRRFEGKSTVARHRMVYEALGALMHDEIHALAIRARTPDEL